MAVTTDACLDSGTSQSLFDGELLAGIGVALFNGPERRYSSTVSGSGMTARVHRVRLEHAQLGTFALDVGFSTVPISRNLLGRDFFELVQLGFRESHKSVFIEPNP